MVDKRAVNLEAYRTDDAIEKYSSYQLYAIEKYLFKKYYKANESILDLACGSGRTTLRLYEMGFSNVKGIDLSDVLINTAKKRFPYLQFEIGSYTDIKERDSSYDHVLISHNGLDYAYPEAEREKALSECNRVLKKNGTLILSSHNIKALHFTPYFFLHWRRAVWKFQNTFNAFRDKAYIRDLGMYTFYGSPVYVIDQVARHHFELIEVRGFRMSANGLFNKYISPYIHFVFRKIN
jgi:ubiquinone/menaquinone biosynthesis C-methylase UbiE